MNGFAVYRENDKKIYIPRFYGIERYGVPARDLLSRGDPIAVPFVKELRDYQETIVQVYVDHVTIGGGGGGILEVPCGRGKTVMALKIMSLLGKKTIILVHKEFLMNQWIEKINEFVPSARVGRIQGSDHDIEDKDIVLGMIQTIYDKDHFDFSSFGLTVIDEVHRIGSEQFSRCLLKIITPYMLGISATVERKDKLTKLLYMFIGPKIYSEKRSDEDDVQVRGIRYLHPDREFNEPILNHRGSIAYSSMISKLCAFRPRGNFIVQVLFDLMQESPRGQIIVLGHNRCLLSFLHDSILEKQAQRGAHEEAHEEAREADPHLVGFYVGGMKKKELDLSETKKIILATYAMAAEGLDIKSLTTLVMVTPKTDITQSVGRILRAKHSDMKPLIVDIIDDAFQNQWKKRRAFYKESDYTIRTVDSTSYTGMLAANDWKMAYSSSKNNDPASGARAAAGSPDEKKCDSQFGKKCMFSALSFQKMENYCNR